MKRLLAYLFIVLGLGITFSVTAHAKRVYCVKIYFEDPKEISYSEQVILSDERTHLLKAECYRTTSGPKYELYEISKKKNKSLYLFFENILGKGWVGSTPARKTLTLNDFKNLLPANHRNYFSKTFARIDKLEKTKLAKAEPSQTQEVAKKEKIITAKFCPNPRLSHQQSGECASSNISFRKWASKKSYFRKNNLCYNPIGASPSHYTDGTRESEVYISYNHTINCNERSNSSDIKWYNVEHIGTEGKFDAFKVIGLYEDVKTQIAKKEPSQTQEVVDKFNLTLEDKLLLTNKMFAYCFQEHEHTKTKVFWELNSLMLEDSFKEDNSVFNICSNIYGINYGIRITKEMYSEFLKTKVDWLPDYESQKSIYDKYKNNILSQLIDEYSKENKNADKKLLAKYFGTIQTQTQMAKAEPTIKPKKKVEVAKTTQEEFKPEEKKSTDNDPPVIQIAEAITVNDANYEIEGRVTDKSKKIFVVVDDVLVDVEDGKFMVKGFSPVDKKISIEAIDSYGNRSKPKIVKIIIDIKYTDIAEKLEPLNPSNLKSEFDKNKVALVIGIENYKQAPKADFANLDARYFKEYATKGFGVPKSNIKLLINDDASLVSSLGTINKWLPGKIKRDQSDLIIFFAGHGLASNDGKELYILPQDGDPDLLSRTALSRSELFQQIIQLGPRSVTIFFDTCYSGVSRNEETLLASARPVRIVADDEGEIPDNFTIFSASQLDQISSGLKEAKHGIFSYYLMKGLEGKADSNKDKQITNGELLAYMDLNVSQRAAELGRQQNPMLSGDENKVLMSYR